MANCFINGYLQSSSVVYFPTDFSFPSLHNCSMLTGESLLARGFPFIAVDSKNDMNSGFFVVFRSIFSLSNSDLVFFFDRK